MDDAGLRRRLERVMSRIDAALERAGRSGRVAIVAVTKGHAPAVAETALDAGLTRLGENRVHELREKVGAVGRHRAEWHMVGHLQRNKVRQVLGLFDLFHAMDSLRLARELSSEAERAGLEVRALAQVNASGEARKYGLSLPETVEVVGAMAELPGIRVQGLMTMAPWTDDEGVQRRTFASTRSLFERCAGEVPGFEAKHLSMGMSNDFEPAIVEGSTMVRLGTILFGERER